MRAAPSHSPPVVLGCDGYVLTMRWSYTISVRGEVGVAPIQYGPWIAEMGEEVTREKKGGGDVVTGEGEGEV